MPERPLPFSDECLWQLAAQYGTPLWVYDAATIGARIGELACFDTIRYAQKACSNIHILRLMRARGVKVDAVSHGEILRALAAGYTGGEDGEIVFTADVLDAATLDCVQKQRVPVNAGSIGMLHALAARAPGHAVWLRINPGFGHGHSRKTNTGGVWSKHGIWHEDLPAALAAVRAGGLRLHGLHMHIGSGVDYAHLQRVCEAMRHMVQAAHAAGHDVRAISAGGGLPTPYRAGDTPVDIAHYWRLWHAARQEMQAMLGHSLALEIEPGRFLVAESGVLLARVCATKNAGQNHFVLVDAGFTELMRPALYGSHHAMHIVPADGRNRPAHPTVVGGPLCESGDVFTQDADGAVLPRLLPAAQAGDLLAIGDAGAYGSSMSGNYNTRPLAAEVLLEDDKPRLIRRRQSVAELLALEMEVQETGAKSR